MGYWIAVLFCTVIAYLFTKYSNNGRRLPPGPWGLPILGHLHMLGDLPHRNLHQLAQKYGPIMHLRLGQVPTIVVSSPEAAELFLKTHDVVFASRPKVQAAEFFSYQQRNLAFAQYGSRWRNLRKLCTVHLLSSSKIESMMSMRKECVMGLVSELGDATGNVVDLSSKVASTVEEIMFGMIIGRSKDARYDFKSSVAEIFQLTGAFSFADYIPCLAPLDLQGLSRRMKAISKVVDGYLENIINEHLQNASALKDNHRDFIDIMLSMMESKGVEGYQLDRDTIKALVLDMIAAAIDTSFTSVEWTISELLRNPRVMKQVQSELENVVGMDRMVEESDLMNLNYLDEVLKESMRLHPVAPLLVPHESTEDITINGYFIPKKSRLIVNFWAIGHDSKVWSANVEKFYPERFMDTNMEFRGTDLRFIPFGSGRRGCPGIHSGLVVVRLMVAQLVHCFNWELPNGMSPEDLDMNEKFGLAMPRGTHLIAVPTSRLNLQK